MHPFILLSADETRKAEAAAMKSGLASAQLMERAGQAIFQFVEHLFQNEIKADEPGIKDAERPTIAILCGPGNNGGDGFVAARLLKEHGWSVRVGLLGSRDNLQGDAAFMAGLYDGDVEPFTPDILQGAQLVIDAILGIGLKREIDGDIAAMVDAVNTHPAPVIAIDIPTGIHADSGTVMGKAINATRTLTFITRKPGHVLYPGRAFCGKTDIAAIGIADEIIDSLKPTLAINDLSLWGRLIPRPQPMTHKYARGSVAVLSGGVASTGAARLAARGALRIGAGAVTIYSPPSAVIIHASHVTSIMIKSIADLEALSDALTDKRISSIVAGPGLGLNDHLKDKIYTILKTSIRTILDADALTGFQDSPESLFAHLDDQDILTPHEGEFQRLFPDLSIIELGRLNAAKLAAARSGAIIVLKGSDSVIAAPDGRAAINVNAPPELATAGSGDVLAGFIAGFAAQKYHTGQQMPAFEAAMAGVWFHGAAAQEAGPGLIAEDLPETIPAILKKLFNQPT